MFIRLNKEQEYRGTKHPEGACIEVGDHLGGQMLLNSMAKQTTREEVSKYEASLKELRDVKKAVRDAMIEKFASMSEKDINKFGDKYEIEGFKNLDNKIKIEKLIEVAGTLNDEL